MSDQTQPIDPSTIPQEQETGNGNPPPKQPSQPPSTDSVDDTGNGNPPPKG